MKKFLLSICIVIASLAITAQADDKPVSASKLPAKATAFIKNFAPATVTAAAVDDDFFRPDYKVYLSDGTAIEFRHNGQWEEVKNYNGIPSKVLPKSIATYLEKNYKGIKVTNISYDADDLDSYEVKLESRLELKFDRSGNFLTVEYDD